MERKKVGIFQTEKDLDPKPKNQEELANYASNAGPETKTEHWPSEMMVLTGCSFFLYMIRGIVAKVC